MKIVVATDIHGINNKLQTLLAELGDLTFLSPSIEGNQPFVNEQEAVAAFQLRDGLSTYQRQIADIANGQPIFLIGFSVGATSAWRYIASSECHVGSHAVVYYGSRIRDSLALVPRCAASVIFAEHEVSFEPKTIASVIVKSGANCATIVGTRHGFMNPSSANYRADIASEQFAMLKQVILQRSAGLRYAKKTDRQLSSLLRCAD